jgi:hypothetical protein
MAMYIDLLSKFTIIDGITQKSSPTLIYYDPEEWLDGFPKDMKIPSWRKEIHWRFPKAFRLRVIVLLMMKLPSQEPNLVSLR